MTTPARTAVIIRTILLALSATFISCGGGGGGSATGQSSSPALSPSPSPATAPLQLNWNPVFDADLDGYYLYHGTQSGNYQNKIWVGNTTRYQITVTASGDHFFAVASADVNRRESNLSAEVTYSF